MTGVKYLRARWHHSHPDEPVWLYSELNDDRWEVRKVYIFPDGHSEWADRDHEVGSTALGLASVPPLDEINADPEFEAEEVSGDEFELVWAEAQAAYEAGTGRSRS